MHWLKKNKPEAVLSDGEHMGFKWLTGHNTSGFRLGYVEIPVGHPWHGVEYMDIDCDVHGGLTYGSRGTEDGEWWIGFDCAHAWDAPDPDIAGDSEFNAWADGEVRSQDYVERECQRLCEQAAEASTEPTGAK